jgi:hypothetical protein
VTAKPASKSAKSTRVFGQRQEPAFIGLPPPIEARKIELCGGQTQPYLKLTMLLHSLKTIKCPSVSTLVWDGDDLVDITSGLRVCGDGSISPRATSTAYPFDRAVCLRLGDTFWSVAYVNRQTKAILMKNGNIHRELNRSFYFAHVYDYPITLAMGPLGNAVVIHCPDSFDTLEVEDAEMGATVAKRKTSEMEFHSRLAASGNGKYLLDAGWFWHPLGGVWICDLGALIAEPELPTQGLSFSFGAEIDSAAFLDDSHVVVTSTDDVVNEAIPATAIGPMKLGVWSLSGSAWRTLVDLSEPAGTIMPWRDWIIGFYECPKAIEIATGKVVYRWDEIYSGRQIGSINLGEPPPPPMAFDPLGGRFAVQGPGGITAVNLLDE